MTKNATGIYERLKNTLVFEWRLIRLKARVRIEYAKYKFELLKNTIKTRFMI